jgi:dephospho-CoA kinase
MKILGLTGSIGMGKTTAAAELRRLGIPVHDADRAVHRLQASGGAAVAPIAGAFPTAVKDGAVDRPALGRIVFADAAALRRLEDIIHPLVRSAEKAFLACQRARGVPLVVLDIPLLFETGGEKRCDAVVVVTAPKFLQDSRVLKRPGMTRERLKDVLMRQMPDGEKRKRADYVVQTGLGRRHARNALLRIVKRLKQR